MRTILILKRLITVFYYLIFIGLIAPLFRIINQIITGKIHDLKPKIFGEQLDYGTMSLFEIGLSGVVPFVLFYCFFQSLIYLKRSLKDLESGNYFSALVITNFKKIGILFLVCSLGEVIGKLLFFIVFKSKFHFELDSSVVLFFIMGLFFMFLSEVFQKARRLQQENELTI
jgi:hypothetical protein